MNIGFLTPEYVTSDNVDGGLANYIKKTARQLAQRGHRITVFVQSDKDSRWNDNGVTVIEVERYYFAHKVALRLLKHSGKLKCFYHFMQHIFAAKTMANAVWKLNKLSPFDILQTSSYREPGLYLTGNKRIPVVCRISSYTPLYRSSLRRKKQFGDILVDWLELRQVIHSDAVYSPSGFMAETFRRLEAVDVDIIRTPTDVETGNLDHAFYENNLSGLRYFLFYGSLNRTKGTDLFASVIPEIAKKHPDVFFVFVGRDLGMPDRMKVFDYIKSASGMPVNRIRYFSSLSKSQLFPVIKNALAVIIPSRVDNYPNVCLEAHFMGTPVIATDNSSLEEMVTEGETGFLARNSNPESICQAIERFMRLSQEDKSKMREKILEHVEGIKTEDRIGRLIEYYDNVISNFPEMVSAKRSKQKQASR